VSQSQEEASIPTAQPQASTPRQSSFGASDPDPWGSPDLHRGHNHTSAPANEPALNGFGSVRSATNGWANTVAATHNEGPTNGQFPPSSSGSGWSAYNNTTANPFGPGGQPELGGFGQQGRDGGISNPPNRAIGSGRVTGSGIEETVTINLLPEKEGVFMFQHRNYEVKSARRGSSVVRRYSDFVWLLDCLQKRYPFRQLPLLPPKRVAGTSKALEENSPHIQLTLC